MIAKAVQTIRNIITFFIARSISFLKLVTRKNLSEIIIAADESFCNTHFLNFNTSYGTTTTGASQRKTDAKKAELQERIAALTARAARLSALAEGWDALAQADEEAEDNRQGFSSREVLEQSLWFALYN